MSINARSNKQKAKQMLKITIIREMKKRKQHTKFGEEEKEHDEGRNEGDEATR